MIRKSDFSRPLCRLRQRLPSKFCRSEWFEAIPPFELAVARMHSDVCDSFVSHPSCQIIERDGLYGSEKDFKQLFSLFHTARVQDTQFIVNNRESRFFHVYKSNETSKQSFSIIYKYILRNNLYSYSESKSTILSSSSRSTSLAFAFPLPTGVDVEVGAKTPERTLGPGRGPKSTSFFREECKAARASS